MENGDAKAKKNAFLFIGYSSDIIDTNEPMIVKEMQKKNHSLLYHVYLKNGEKEKALDVLNKEYTSKCSISQIQEIIYTYMYFKDYSGALLYIEGFKGTIPEIIPIEALIKMQIADKKKGCEDDTVFHHAVTGITAFYDKRIIVALKDFYKGACNGCFNACFMKKLEVLEEIIINNYYEKLTYKEAKNLYKVMLNKAIFLKKMVETNPFIKRRYYFQYANLFGIHKSDILRILAVRACPWAFSIALFYGWVDSSLKTILQDNASIHPVCLNASADWNWDYNKMMTFTKRYIKRQQT
ncbi:hypothetical protein GINT2_000434 [Glugoides intestinalis]